MPLGRQTLRRGPAGAYMGHPGWKMASRAECLPHGMKFLPNQHSVEAPPEPGCHGYKDLMTISFDSIINDNLSSVQGI